MIRIYGNSYCFLSRCIRSVVMVNPEVHVPVSRGDKKICFRVLLKVNPLCLNLQKNYSSPFQWGGWHPDAIELTIKASLVAIFFLSTDHQMTSYCFSDKWLLLRDGSNDHWTACPTCIIQSLCGEERTPPPAINIHVTAGFVSCVHVQGFISLTIYFKVWAWISNYSTVFNNSNTTYTHHHHHHQKNPNS